MWWLEFDDGMRRGLDGRGLIVGRRADCDVVSPDPRASSIHCLLVLSRTGPELRSLGRNPTIVQGKPETSAQLVHGDWIEVPGLRMKLVQGLGASPRWVVVVRGRRFGVRGGLSFGGRDDDVFVPGWADGALKLEEVQGGLVLEVGTEITLGGERLEPGWVEVVEVGDVLGVVEDQVEIDLADAETEVTIQRAVLPIEVRFEFRPTGGLLELSFADQRTASVELPELRARLVAVLLGSPGEFVEDDELLRRIWPGRSDRGRTDLNTLVHRARKDLLRSGVNPGPLLVRARGGGGAAFHVSRGAKVEI